MIDRMVDWHSKKLYIYTVESVTKLRISMRFLPKFIKSIGKQTYIYNNGPYLLLEMIANRRFFFLQCNYKLLDPLSENMCHVLLIIDTVGIFNDLKLR